MEYVNQQIRVSSIELTDLHKTQLQFFPLFSTISNRFPNPPFFFVPQ